MTAYEQLPPRSRLVSDRLRELGVNATIQELPDSTHTAREAAAALGCSIGAIASSLVFRVDDAPTLVLTSGRHRVDPDALATALDATGVELASPKDVKKITGQPIGGVAPVGHTKPLPTVVDAALRDYDEIWVAAGTPHTVTRLTFDDLVKATAGTVVAVASP